MSTIAGLMIRIAQDATQMVQGMKDLEQTITRTASNADKQLKKIDKSVKEVGRSGFSKFQANIVTINQGLQLVTATFDKLRFAFGGAATQFDTTLTKIVGLVGVSREQVNKWREDILKLGSQVGKVPEELADGLYYVTSAGVETSKAMDVLAASAKASAAGVGTVAQVADVATSAMNAYGSANLSADKAIGVLIATVREGKAEATAIASAIGRAIPLANQIGISFDQVGAAMAAMTRVGLSAEESVTALRAIMQASVRPTDKAQKSLEAYGLAGDFLLKRIREKGLIEALNDLMKAVGGNERAVTDILGELTAVTGAFALTGANAEETRRIFNSLAQETGQSLNKAFDEVSKTAGFKFQQAMAATTALLIRLGDVVLPALLPYLDKFVTYAEQLSQKISQLTPNVKNFGVVVAGLVVASGPLTLMVSKFSTLIGLLSSPVGATLLAIAGGIAGLGVAADAANKNIEGLTKGLDDISVDKLKTLFQEKLNAEGVEGLKKSLDGLRKSFSSLPPEVQSLVNETEQWLAQMNRTNGAVKITGVVVEDLKKKTGSATPAVKVLTEEQIKQAEALRKSQEEMTKENALLAKKVAVLRNAKDNLIPYTMAMEQVAALTASAKVEDGGLAAENARLTATFDALEDALKNSNDEFFRRQDALNASREAATNFLNETYDAVEALERQNSIMRQGVATGRPLQQTMHMLAVAEARAALEAGNFQGNLDAMAERMVRAREEGDKLRETLNRSSSDSGLAGIINRVTDNISEGLGKGTLKIKNILKAAGGASVAEFAKEFLFGKDKKLDLPFEQNITSLVGPDGLIGSIFGQGGANSAANFASNFFSTVKGWFGGAGGGGEGGQQASGFGFDFGSLFGSSASSGAADSWTSGWDSLTNGSGGSAGFFGQSGAAAGQGWGSAFGVAGAASALATIATSFSQGKYGSGIGGVIGGGIGAVLGGPAGAVIGAQIGSFFGSLFDGLFKHKPTKGTVLRKNLEQWFDDIGVTFASLINHKKYNFEETKSIAKAMFGGDFLKASEYVLEKHVGPQISRQLEALGAFVQAEEAKKLGKPVAQAAITFGNLLENNLGVKALPDAIDEIVDKANISFEEMIKKFNRLLSDNDISKEFYDKIVKGAVDIFYSDLPEAINVSALALKAFGEDGVFNLEKFNKELEYTKSVYDKIAEEAWTALTDPKLGKEAGQKFVENLKKSLGLLALKRWFEDVFVKDLFKDIDLSDGVSDAEIETLKSRINKGKEAVDRMADSFGGLGDSAEEATTALDDLKNKIMDVEKALAELQDRRINIEIEYNQRLVDVGAITDVQNTSATLAARRAQADPYFNMRSPIGTHPFVELNDTELERAIGFVQQYSDAIVSNYNAEVDAINNRTALAIQAVHDEYDAKREAVDETIDQLRKQRDAQQKVFQDQLQALNEQLNVAKKFASAAESAKSAIERLTVGDQSPYSKSQQMANLLNKAADLRKLIARSSGETKATAINDLIDTLQSLSSASPFAATDVRSQRMTKDILNELTSLESMSRALDNSASLEQQIASTEASMESFLSNIDSQIESQQDLLKSLSKQEESAVKDLENAATLEIDKLRVGVVEQLEKNRKLEQDLLTEQIFRLEQQKEELVRKLTELVTPAEATAMLADPDGYLLVTTVDSNKVLHAMLAALGGTISAATGYEGDLTSNQLFMAHAGEHVSIRPRNNPTAAYMGLATANRQQGLVVPIAVQGSTNEQIAQLVARELKRTLDASMKQAYRSNTFGTTIKRDLKFKGQ